MNKIADAYNHDSPESNAFYPYRYGLVADWIERLSPNAINRLGWDSDDDLLHMVNQEFMLTEIDFDSNDNL